MDGLPLKRVKAFVDMAVLRSKQMVYGVPEAGFDSEALLKLEDDGLVRRSNGLVSPAHDVLEDWALERFIEEAYSRASGEIADFLNTVGNEPAMNRAFRLWLSQKLRFGEDVKPLILTILLSRQVQRYWQDETIAAILLSDDPHGFLRELGDRLFDNEAELLKRVCFVLRIACKTPNNELMQLLDREKAGQHLFLRPHGSGWSAMIRFLFENSEKLQHVLITHVTEILDEWSSSIHIDAKMPEQAREAGLLALRLLETLKDSYQGEDVRTKILGVIIKTVPAIENEFKELLDRDVFARCDDDRPNYVDAFCKMALETFDTVFLCKYVPDIVIKLALAEFLIDESDDHRFDSWHVEVEHHFGLHPYKREFFPPSGAKGPFQHLLKYHPRLGLDFILQLLNASAEKYFHSDLDFYEDETDANKPQEKTSGERVLVTIDDQTSVEQYCSARLWGAYRSHSVAPYLLESALMALENWLVALAERPDSHDTLNWVFDYILRNSNSVMPTAVLASVATGFPVTLGKASLPILRTPAFYDLDLARTIRERGGDELNWFGSPFRRDPAADIYVAERRASALRPWRRESLETLIIRLQLGELKQEALGVIDGLRLNAPEIEEWRFRLHRIDTRGWEAKEDKENNRIIFQPQELEPELQEIQKQSQEVVTLHERFSRMYLWASNEFDRKVSDREYYAGWEEALEEAENLSGIMAKEPYWSRMYRGGLVKAASAIVRDHSSQLNGEDASWCIDTVASAVVSDADADSMFGDGGKSDMDGSGSAASVLPILFDLADSEEEQLSVKALIATAISHANANVRTGIANGIREHLWQRDEEFARHCFFGAIEYARLEVENWARSSTSLASVKEEEAQSDNAQLWNKTFRDKLAEGEISFEMSEVADVGFDSHSAWHILAPFLMIPDGSNDPDHVGLVSRMLELFFETEESVRRRGHDHPRYELYVNYELSLEFRDRLTEHLVALRRSGSARFTDQLIQGCGSAPEFIESLLLSVAVATEKCDEKEIYWDLWEDLSKSVQDIAIQTAGQSSERGISHTRKLIRGMLAADLPWTKIDYENQYIALGKEPILEFARNAGANVDVFEALSSLMYHFRGIFFESGVHILAKHQSQRSGIELLAGINTAFYLEGSIRSFLLVDETGPLTREMHQSCFTLLDALVETASSRAYYLREQLIRTRRIL